MHAVKPGRKDVLSPSFRVKILERGWKRVASKFQFYFCRTAPENLEAALLLRSVRRRSGSGQEEDERQYQHHDQLDRFAPAVHSTAQCGQADFRFDGQLQKVHQRPRQEHRPALQRYLLLVPKFKQIILKFCVEHLLLLYLD